jgi:hypothetical protein
MSFTHFLDESKFMISFFDGKHNRKMLVGWEELKKSVDFLENNLKFQRKPKIQEKYDLFMQDMKDNSIDMTHHILKNEMLIDNLNSVGVDNKFILRRNKYPYDFGTHKHFVLWIHPNCDTSLKSKIFKKEGCERIIKDLTSKYPDIINDQFIIFRNASKNKSVETIEHFHVVFY